MKRFLILAVVSGLGLSACATAAPQASRPAGLSSPAATSSDGGTGTEPSPKAKPASKSKSGSQKSTGAQTQSCDPARGGTDGEVAQLVDVRVGTHEGYDRVTFEFAPPSDGQYFGLPKYDLHRATPPIREDGSGDPVSMDGSHFAWIVFHGAAGYDFVEGGPTYTGPRGFKRDFRMLAEARQTGDYEATLSWAFGLNSASCWKVHVLQDPLRVAIDFPHE